VFHGTSASALGGILENNEFMLGGYDVDRAMNPPDKPYSFCVSRSVRNAYRDYNYREVLLVLDGDKFNNRYSGHAVDFQAFHQAKDYSRGSGDTVEMEDRVFSKDRIIPDACSYIKAIHMWLGKSQRGSVNMNRMKKDWELAKQKGIPIYVYNSMEGAAFSNLETSRAMKDDEIEWEFSDSLSTDHYRKML
jgi:hypothetical protein